MSDLVDRAESLRSASENAGLFTEYLVRSWKGIINSSGVF
jgi:hypothetical protein